METETTKNGRRNFIRMLFVVSGCGLGIGRVQAFPQGEPWRPLTDKDRFNTGDGSQDLVEQASLLGRDYLKRYRNCAQATIAALQDAIDFIPNNGDIFMAGSCLHGGATETGNANCGGFTGAAIVIGHLCGTGREGKADHEAMKLANALLRQVARRFEDTYGSVICRDVREKAGKKCPEVIAQASGWAAESILQQFSRNRV